MLRFSRLRLSRACLAGLLLASLPLASAARAAIADREMSCADWLKTSARKKSDHPAAVEAKIRAFCAANPKMKAVDAEMTMTGD